MEYKVLEPSDASYPSKLRGRSGENAPRLYWAGPLNVLKRFSIAVAASDSIPAQAIMATNQLLFTIREYSANYIGGWHSVIETEIFRIALDRRSDPQGTRSLTLFSARGLQRETWEGFLADRFGPKGPFTGFPEKDEYFRRANSGELLVLSVTDPSQYRMTPQGIIARNYAACALADVVFIPFAERGTKTYKLCKLILSAGIPVFGPDCAESSDLVELGIPLFDRKTVATFLNSLGGSCGGPPAFAVTAPRETIVYEQSKDIKSFRQTPNQYGLFDKD